MKLSRRSLFAALFSVPILAKLRPPSMIGEWNNTVIYESKPGDYDAMVKAWGDQLALEVQRPTYASLFLNPVHSTATAAPSGEPSPLSVRANP